jgi:hypothetical protein
MTAPTICPAGHFCNSANLEAAQQCAAGTYSPVTGLIQSSSCVPCKEGYYCNAGTTNPTLKCTAGYYCPSKAIAAIPAATTYAMGSTTGGKCPTGYMCPAGTEAPIPCPVGKYQDLT